MTASDWRLDRDFLTSREAEAALTCLQAELPWTQPQIQLFGRQVPVPRLVCLQGEPGSSYRWSGLTQHAAAWHPLLKDLQQRLLARYGWAFDIVLCNLYRHGADCMGWHSDDEAELDPAAPIASLSLGAERDCRFRPRGGGPAQSLSLPSGSCLLMAPGCQQRWQHSLPKRLRVSTPRLNCTFRSLRR